MQIECVRVEAAVSRCADQSGVHFLLDFHLTIYQFGHVSTLSGDVEDRQVVSSNWAGSRGG